MGMNDDYDSFIDSRLTNQIFAASLMIALNIGEYLVLIVGCFTDEKEQLSNTGLLGMWNS